ncbi:MAG: TRAP transporter large permease subunit [Defluviicoccus sp.]|nr:TRAP transporter large permease subunit [Defluviicoccus sp.]MDE0386773.1 TRAP transporter large permease subunit [Defluviicoccus sp.]
MWRTGGLFDRLLAFTGVLPGAIVALLAVGVAAACYRSLSWKGLWTAMVETGKLAVTIYFIIAASLTFSQMLSFSGATTGLLSLIQQIDPTPLSLPIAMMALMLPALEIGQTAPPFGMLLFVMRGVAPPDTTMGQIYAAVAPFVVLEIGILAFLMAVPAAVTWLPQPMAG